MSRVGQTEINRDIMNQVFILQNQYKQLLNRQIEWFDGRDAASLYKTFHKDEALNHMFELNAKDHTQRIEVLTCNVNERGIPVVEEGRLPSMALEPSPPLAAKHASLTEQDEGNESLFVENIVVDTTDLSEPS